LNQGGRKLKAGSVSKFIFAVCVAIAALKADRFAFIITMITLAAAALVIWTRQFRYLIEVARTVIWFFVFIFILHLFSRGGVKLFSLLFLTATREGAATGLFYGAKLVVFALSAFIILRTVDPFELIRPLERLSRFLGKYGRPLSYSALALSLALRFIPDLIRQAAITRMALNTRGVTFQGGAIIRLRAAVMLVSAVFVSAFKNAESTAMALSVKGYSTRHTRAVLPRINFSISGIFTAAVSAAVVIFGWRY